MPADGPQQRIVAHRQHQSPSEGGRWATAEGKPEMMDETFQARRAPCRRRQHIRIEALGKYPSSTQNRLAAKAAGDHLQADGPAGNRQVREATRITAMNPSRDAAAARANAGSGSAADGDHRCGAIQGSSFDSEAWRNEIGRPERVRHRADSLEKQHEWNPQLHQN